MITGICRYTKGEFSQDTLDEVWNKGKETFKDPIPPPSSGIIINTPELAWDDMHEANTGWVSHMPSSYGQFKGPVLTTNWRGHSFDKMLIWLEIEAGGNGNGCSPDTNPSTNTAVEVGYIRSYTKRNNQWELSLETKNMSDQGTGGQYQVGGRWDGRKCLPIGGMVPGRDDVPTQDDLYDNPERREVNYPLSPSIVNVNTGNGYLSVSPARLHRFHGWTKSTYIEQDGLQGYYGVAYVRLVLKDPDGIDDRQVSNYVGHIACDIRKDPNNTYVNDIGMSRYKKITTDWVAMNFFSFQETETKDEFLANPPPFSTTP